MVSVFLLAKFLPPTVLGSMPKAGESQVRKNKSKKGLFPQHVPLLEDVLRNSFAAVKKKD